MEIKPQALEKYGFSADPHHWKVIGPDGTTENDSTGNSYGCLDSAEKIPGDIGPGERLVGKIVLDSAHSSGAVALTQTLMTGGWEWSFASISDSSGVRPTHQRLHSQIQPADQGHKLRPISRIATSLCIVAAIIFSTGCGSSPAPEAATSTTDSEQPIQVDEGLLTVDVTITRPLLDPSGEDTDEEIVQAAKENGMRAAINPDGSVTYTMSRAQQREMLDRMRASVTESIADLVNDPENSLVAVDMNDDLTQFTVQVDAERYSLLDPFYAIVFYVAGGLYQQFDGVTADDLDVAVDFVDNATGELLDSGSLRAWLDSEQHPE